MTSARIVWGVKERMIRHSIYRRSTRFRQETRLVHPKMCSTTHWGPRNVYNLQLGVLYNDAWLTQMCPMTHWEPRKGYQS